MPTSMPREGSRERTCGEMCSGAEQFRRAPTARKVDGVGEEGRRARSLGRGDTGEADQS
jgi:hypothetical protein